jgi:hypothetical protein
MSEQISVSIEKVNPIMAREWLETRIPRQRKIKPKRVESYAKMMLCGDWKIPPDCIMFTKGQLANGQHRLLAIIASNRTLPFVILRTNDETVYQVTDAGCIRNPGDALPAEAENKHNMAAMGTLILHYLSESISRMSMSARIVSRPELVRFITENYDELQSVYKICQNGYNKVHVISPVLTGALGFLVHKKYKERVVEFIEKLYEGTSDKIILNLRNRLLNDRLGGHSLSRSYQFGLLIKGFNAFIIGNGPKLFKIVEGEDFPKIIE